MFVGIYRGINIPGFLRWCEMDFVRVSTKEIGGSVEQRILNREDCQHIVVTFGFWIPAVDSKSP